MQTTHHDVKVSSPLSAFIGIGKRKGYAVDVRESFWKGSDFIAYNHTVYGMTKAEATRKANALAAALQA